MTADQIKKARTLVSIHGINEENKKDMVASFTDGRTESLREMTPDEARAIIKHLEALGRDNNSPAERMKRKIIAIAHDLNWRIPGTKRIDMKRIDDWCRTKFGETLDKLNYDLLPKAVRAFSAVKNSYNKF